MKVRQATLLDILTIAPLALDYSKEAQNHGNFPYDVGHAMDTIARSIMTDGGVFICFDGNEPVGFLWGFLSTMPWSKRKIAFDVALYVNPYYRGTPAFLKLERAYREWATEQGAVEIQLSIASGIHEERTGNVYSRLGYNHIGTQYRKEL